MKTYRFVLLVSLFLFFVAPPPIVCYAADQDRQTIESLLSDLEQKSKEGDQKMIAHPKFLEELKALVKQYRSRLRVVYLSEDFADGNYSYHPVWVVDSGKFQVTGSRRLLSEVLVERPAPASPTQEKASPLGGLLRDILKAPETGKSYPCLSILLGIDGGCFAGKRSLLPMRFTIEIILQA